MNHPLRKLVKADADPTTQTDPVNEERGRAGLGGHCSFDQFEVADQVSVDHCAFG